ncbi:MAG: carbohydrate kinase family protein [Chloroflexaceae bacterium]|nr:carbohydrate kinase family protein [Chloroflexaceae bacterium]
MRRSHQLNIAVLGDINADLTVYVPSYPAEGDDSTATGVRWASGGTGLNAATALAVLGAQARLLGRVGTDPAAQVALHAARKAGVDVSLVQHDPAVATGLCSTVVSAGGQRTFFAFRGANVCFDSSNLSPATFAHTNMLYLSGYALLEGPQRTAALHAIELANRLDIPIAFDLALPLARDCGELINELLPRIWLLSMNEDEQRYLAPTMQSEALIEAVLARGVAHVALKQGVRGCLVASASGQVSLAPPNVAAIDTNGCGDAFATAYAMAALQHADMHTCATLANLMGALTATRPGAAEGLPPRHELLAWLDPAHHWLITSDE